MSEKTLHLVVEELSSTVQMLSARLAQLEGVPVGEKEWLTVREVAALLNLSENRVYQLRHFGRLTPVKRGRLCLFNREQVKKLINEQSEQ